MATRINSKPEDGARFAEKMNAFWIEPQKRDVMGYKLTGIADGEIIPQGTPLKTDEVNKTAVVCNYGYVDAVATDKKTLTMKPGHRFSTSTKVAISGDDSLVELSIASVNDNVVVLSAANNDIAAGDVLVEVVTTGSGESAVVSAKNLPNRVASSNSDAKGTIAAAHEAIVLQNVVHYPAEYLNKTTFPGDILLVGCAGIRFTIQ